MAFKSTFVKTFIFLFYAVMMAILLSWTDPVNPPPEAWRYTFLGVLMIPFLFDGSVLTIAIISIFYTISYYGYAFSYMPQRIMTYVAIIIICIITNRKIKLYNKIEGWRSFVVFGVYVIILNLIASFSPIIANGGSVLFCLFFPFFISKDWRGSVKVLEHSFIIISIIMSIQYLAIGDQAILVANQDDSGLTRTGWTDPNHYASIIGMGVVISIMLLMERKEQTFFPFLYYGGAIVISLMVVLLNASRGATAAIALSVLLLLFKSKIKTTYKLLIAVLVVAMLIALNDYGYFDLLKVRVEAGDGSAGGRTAIWSNKIDGFLATGNPLELLFGVGFEKGLVLGTNMPTSFHNDYICAFVDYGLVGFILFITMLIMPVIKAPKIYRPIILALAAYLWVVGFTLSPLTEGFVPYYIFLFYVFVKMQMFREQEKIILNHS